ncbi:hypothetical protein [Parvularcula lutaonensis]|uniref:Uncharacterized protein n=1 Tax=Parvularcula lutaonensis TaxID=491923 RepID=A0ABV7M6W3_9PROT|nr:hypothetical protein [Parvularcula lutaonensis]GGY56853.1 hypothetical protein GCM10007148_27960 [Parvularcula lutaonensis]
MIHPVLALAAALSQADAAACPVTGDAYEGLGAAVEGLFAAYPANEAVTQPLADDAAALLGELGRELPGPEAVNFAGGYILVSFGCGTECQAHVVVNGDGGKMVSGPTTGHGGDWREDSALFIANPPAELTYFGSDAVPSHLTPSCSVFDGETFSDIPCEGFPDANACS